MPHVKSMTIRQDDDQATTLELVARVDEMPIAHVVKLAITSYIEARRADLEFQDRLRRLVATERELASKLLEARDGATGLP